MLAFYATKNHETDFISSKEFYIQSRTDFSFLQIEHKKTGLHTMSLCVVHLKLIAKCVVSWQIHW